MDNSTSYDVTMYDDSIIGIVCKSLPVLWLLVGVIGNVTTLLSLTRHKDLSAGNRIYHGVLTLVDLLLLGLSLLRYWVLLLVHHDPFASPTFICKTLPWLESSLLTAFPWLLVSMALQVWEGLKMEYDSGRNVTRWKTRVYAAFVVGVSIMVNVHILLFFGPPKPTGAENKTVTSGNEPYCVPNSAGYDDFTEQVWPWMSLSGSLCLPLVGILILQVLNIRLLIKRSRQTELTPLPVQFRNMVISCLLLSLVTIMTSFPLCGLAFTDPKRFWSDYTDMSAVNQDGYLLWCVFRVVFYAQCAFRWIVTCWCCELWPIIAAMCRKEEREAANTS